MKDREKVEKADLRGKGNIEKREKVLQKKKGRIEFLANRGEGWYNTPNKQREDM